MNILANFALVMASSRVQSLSIDYRIQTVEWVCLLLCGDSVSGMFRHHKEPLKILLILCVLAKGSICQMLINHRENE